MNLELENISKSFGKEIIIDQLSLTVATGELFSILGASGSGKTTLLKIIAGLVTPDEGRVLVDGIDITALPTEERGIPYIFQAPFLFPHMTVEENIAFGLHIKKWPSRQVKNKVDHLLHFLRIGELRNRLPSQLSGGQQQRVAIGRALAPEARLLLMDEPFSSLDYDLRLEMGALLKDIRQEWQQTIVFVTHDRQEGLSLSDQMALLIKGRIEQCGKPHQIYYQPLTSQLALFMGAGNFIPGMISREVFHSPLGELPATGERDGQAKLFLRPHQLTIDNRGTGFTVLEIKDFARERRITLNNKSLQILVETFSDAHILLGTQVGLAFSQTNLHFIRE